MGKANVDRDLDDCCHVLGVVSGWLPLVIGRFLGVLAFIASCSLGAGIARAQAYPSGAVEPVRSTAPQYKAANDPWPGRPAVRASAPVAANDNLLRGLGRSAGAVGDDLALIMSQEEATRRQAKYIRGVGKALSGAGGAKYLNRLGKIAKPLGGVLALYEIYDLGRDLVVPSDGVSADSLSSAPRAMIIDAPQYAGQRVFGTALIPGALYITDITGRPGEAGTAFPIGKYFVGGAYNNFYIWLVTVATATETANPCYCPLVDSEGSQYYEYYHFAVDGATNRRIKFTYRSYSMPGGYSFEISDGWWRLNGPGVHDKPSPVALPDVAPAEVPQAEEAQPISPEPLKEVVKKGLEEAGVQATPEQVQRYADHAAAGMKAGDLNGSPADLTNPGDTPLADYVPSSVVSQANDPATDASTDPNPDPNPEPEPGTGGSGGAATGYSLDAAMPTDTSWIPKINIGSLDMKAEQCPGVDIPTPYWGVQHLDIGCSIWEGPYKPLFRGIAMAMVMLAGFFAFRGR